MRRRMLANLGGWKNPYITDGLVAMVDGEWNVGGGVSDRNATTITELVTGKKINLGDDRSVTNFQNKCLFIKNGNKANIDIDYIYDGILSKCTIETVFREDWKLSDVKGNINTPIRSYFGAFVASRWYDAYDYVSYESNKLNTSTNFIPISGIVSGSAATGNSKTIFLNGEKYALGNFYSEPYVTRAGITLRITARADSYLYCARVYSRVLSDQEILANYEIDKARFGLP